MRTTQYKRAFVRGIFCIMVVAFGSPVFAQEASTAKEAEVKSTAAKSDMTDGAKPDAEDASKEVEDSQKKEGESASTTSDVAKGDSEATASQGAATSVEAESTATASQETAAAETQTAPTPIVAPAEAPVKEEVPVEVVPKVEKEETKSWTDFIKLKGDFRYRFEMIKRVHYELRYRHRLRARVAAIGTVVDGLDVGVQIATGSQDPVSTNQTLGEFFSTKPVWIDLAYADWHPGFAKGLKLLAGKMKNPFFSVGKSELIWDPDLTPEGLALGYKNSFGIVEPFIQTAAFYVQERKDLGDATVDGNDFPDEEYDDDDSWILGIQGGLKLNFLDGKFHVLAGMGYVDHTNINQNLVYVEHDESFGNSSEVVDSGDYLYEDDEEYEQYIHDYNIIESFAEIGWKAGPFPMSVFFTTAANVAIKNDDDFGWLVGAKFGKCKKQYDFDLRYIYRKVPKDAVVGAFTDSDFRGGGTDGKGHEINLGFQIAKNVKLAGTYFYNQRGLSEDDDVAIDKDRKYHRGQIDFKLKF